MSISIILLILVLGAMVVLGIFTALNNLRRRTNIYFGVICFSLAAWILVNYFADNDLANTLAWSRLAFFFVAFVMMGFVLFANSFPAPTIKRGSFDWGVIGLGTMIALLSFAPDFIPRVNIADGTSNVVTGNLYWLFPLYVLIYSVLTFGLLIPSYYKSKGSSKARLRFVLLGALLTLIFSAGTNLVLPLLTGNNDLARYGGYFTLFFITATSYAIVKHRMFNIRLLVARSVAYVLLLGTLATVYGLAIFSVSSVFFQGSNVGSKQSVTYVALAVVLAFTFQPLKSFFEKITDRLFFRDRYDSQEVLNELSTTLINEFNLGGILKNSLKQLCENLHLQSGQFYIFNEGRVYKVEHYGPLPKRLAVAPELMHLKKTLIVTDELEGGMAKSVMEGHGIRLALRLATRDQFVGFLLLGDKLSGDIYSNQDIDLLQIAAKEIAVAISNAKAYEEIAQFNITLQDKVEQATKRLRTANRHLKELDEAKDEFISMASHQLRTPLTSIKGYVSMLIEGDAGPLQPQQKEFLNYAYSGTNRMVALISDLLNVSRMQAGRFMIERAPIDLDAVVAEETSNLQTHAQPKGLKLKYLPPKAKLPLVNIDENKTRQVIMNFIDNAIYYTKQGSVTVSLDKVGDAVELRVKDTGIGVPKEAQKKLFHKFYRAENAQGVRPDGTGLGLFLAKRVVEDQGGHIIFETTEGRGSTFGFALPLSAVKVTENAKSKETIGDTH